MRPAISVFLDASVSPHAPSPTAAAEWHDVAGRRDIELVPARDLHDAARAATAPVVAWLGLDAPVDDMLPIALRGAQMLQASGAAAASLSAFTPRLSPLGVPTCPPSPEPGAAVLIPSACAAVFDRDCVRALPGDLDLSTAHADRHLGWRLALLGLRVVQGEPLTHAPPVGKRSRVSAARRLRADSLHQLTTLFMCAGDEWLRGALPAAVARILALAAARADLDPRTFDFGSLARQQSTLPVESVALLLAIESFARGLEVLRFRRRRVQQTRRCADGDILPLFEHRTVDASWEHASGAGAEAICRMLGLTDFMRTGRAPVRPRETAAETPRHTPPVLRDHAAPRVSIIILTRLGPTHLPACLDALAALDYPAERIDVIVVDNASDIDPSGVVYQHYPNARVLRQDENLGFCGGNNVGAQAARHEWLMFLNDDTRVHPEMLNHLFATAQRRSAACVSALVLDWEGERVDFGGGAMNFEAKGFQQGVGDSDIVRWAVERPLLFANGAAILVHRDAYAAAGGFPDAYFAYYEDVALGWALWLTGEEVWLSPGARVFHRHHGTSSTSSHSARARNCERNALYTLLTHMHDDGLGDVLSASLLLAGTRVVLGLELGGFRPDPLAPDDDGRLRLRDRLSLRVVAGHVKAELLRRGAKKQLGVVGSARQVGIRGLTGTVRSLSHLMRWGGPPRPPQRRAAEEYVATASGLAALAACAEWCANATLMERPRLDLQARRRRSDHAVISRFGENWLHAVPVDAPRQAEYEETHRAVATAFNLERFLAS